jgi:hypothetical protein
MTFVSWRALSYLAGAGVNTGDVDARDELDGGRVIGVVGSAVDVNTVYTVFVDALSVD